MEDTNGYCDALEQLNWLIDQEYLASLPPGYRFLPTDEDLIEGYLLNKVMARRLPPNRMWEVDIYNYDPEELADNFVRLREKAWFFFTPKCLDGSLPNRATPGGFWKPKKANSPIRNGQGEIIGYKTSLEFHEGKASENHAKINWKMHEYMLPIDDIWPAPGNKMPLVSVSLCKIYNVSNGRYRASARSGCTQS